MLSNDTKDCPNAPNTGKMRRSHLMVVYFKYIIIKS